MGKRILLGFVIMGCLCILPVLGFAQEKGPDVVVDDITKEVLTGPSDLDPEKILGPGSVAITTTEDILMSFGATVRFIPTAESNWDFGMSDNVDGFVSTQALKSFAGGVMTTANTGHDIFSSMISFSNALTEDRGVVESYENFIPTLYAAQSVLAPTADAVTQGKLAFLTDSAAELEVNSDAAYKMAFAQAATEYQTAIVSQDMTIAGDALQAIATNTSYQAAVAAGDLAAAQAIAAQIATPFVLSYAGNAGDDAATGVIKQYSQDLLAGADSVVQSIAAKITSNPNATSQDIAGALAYATVLKAQADSFSPYYLVDSFYKTHSNESGSVNDGYIRNETKLYFNAMPKDKKWSFYAALEFDRPIDTDTIDNRGGKTAESSNFGLERLNASIEIVEGLRLHAGWDVWGIDIIEAASMVYGDDNAGFWLKGDYSNIQFSAAWLKLEENDFQIQATDHNGANDEDRDLFAAYMDYEMATDQKIRFFGAWDRIRSVQAADLLGVLAQEANLSNYAGITGGTPETDAYTFGAYYLGKFGVLELMGEVAYKFGEAKDTGLKGEYNGRNVIEYDDFDINSYALAADMGFELGEIVDWMSFKPHIGIMYTSGDDDPTDDELSGYSGITNAQRFSAMWGGENTIIGDTNFVLGSALYGYVPELYGNGTPVFVGGLQNFAGGGSGRGDNPGLTMVSAGITLRPKIFLIYRTNVNMFHWNEDFYVTDMVNPIDGNVLATGVKKEPVLVEAGYVGTEWDNEITVALSKHMFVKGQASMFFPGDGVKDVTKALTGGTENDEIATRIAAELIWNF